MLVITSNPVIATSQANTIMKAINIALEFSRQHNLALKSHESMRISLEINKRLKVGHGQVWLVIQGEIKELKKKEGSKKKLKRKRNVRR